MRWRQLDLSVARSFSKNPQVKTKPQPPTRLLLVRHAEIEPRYQHAFGGQLDIRLSARGQAQAKTLANFLRGKKIAALYASPMKRVQQTLAPFLNNGAPAQTVLPGLREVDFGDWTGFTWDEVREKFGVHPYDWLDEIELGTVPNGESGVQFRARVEPCLLQIIRRNQGSTIAIFTHGGVIRMMLSILLDLPLPKTNSFEIEYASVTQIALRPEFNEIELLNFTPWRDWVR
ncbi:MAG TPA: histidine phosphatase family protein [Candidatus Saccharimonadales bacterium]|nr:histidine phosphatase family protein [Candidatus Saccharimonadales bacterium]